MLKDNELDDIIQPIVNLYSTLERDLMVEIAQRFANYDGVTGTLEWQLKKLDELGGVNKALVKIIEQYSDKSKKEILEILQQAGYSNIDMGVLSTAYENGAAAVTPETLMQSENIKNIINLSYADLQDTLSLINTKALESSKQNYINILNTAYLDAATGMHSLQESCNTALQKMAKDGIGGATYKRGNRYVHYSIEGVVRRDVVTAANQLANKVSIQSCEEMGAEYVEISKHLGARTHPTNPIANHAGWQGKVFKINGSTSKYKNLRQSTGYPDDILGLSGVNCRHRMFPFFPGISMQNPVEIDSEKNERIYKATQKQRRLEREMRTLKKQKAVAVAVGDEETAQTLDYKIKLKDAQLNEWCEQNNLRRDYSRELVQEQLPLKNVAKSQNSGIIELSRNIDRKEANTGAFSNLEIPMQKRQVLNLCKKYNIGTQGITFKIQRSESLLSLSICGSTDYDNIGRIDMFPNAFVNEEQLIKTVLHEKCHYKQLLKYGKNNIQNNLDYMEKVAYRFENVYYSALKGRL